MMRWILAMIEEQSPLRVEYSSWAMNPEKAK